VGDTRLRRVRGARIAQRAPGAEPAKPTQAGWWWGVNRVLYWRTAVRLGPKGTMHPDTGSCGGEPRRTAVRRYGCRSLGCNFLAPFTGLRRFSTPGTLWVDLGPGFAMKSRMDHPDTEDGGVLALYSAIDWT
jgi:hypothetical protein